MDHALIVLLLLDIVIRRFDLGAVRSSSGGGGGGIYRKWGKAFRSRIRRVGGGGRRGYALAVRRRMGG